MSSNAEEQYERDGKGENSMKKYRSTASACRNVVRKAKTQPELKLAEDVAEKQTRLLPVCYQVEVQGSCRYAAEWG